MQLERNMPALIKADQFNHLAEHGATPVDIRDGNELITGFIPGSIFLGDANTFRQWSSTLISQIADIILITETGAFNELKDYLPLMERYAKVYILEGGMKAWMNSNGARDMIITIDTEELVLDLKFDKNLLLLDLREPDPYADEHVEGAVNLPLKDMGDFAQIAGVEEDVNLYLYDESPINSLIAASIFKRHGYQHLRVIHQGWSLIKKYKGMPLITQRKQKENP